jgi:hypothetical protein
LTAARALLLAAAAASCYGTPRTDPPGTGTAGSGGGAGIGTGGVAGGVGGTGGSVGGQSGGAGGASGSGGGPAGASGSSGGQAGTGGTPTAGTGGSGAGGSNVVFVGGPCVVTPDRTGIEVFGRTSDGRILRRAFDGANWGGWTNLIALDGRMIDARSDLDCSPSAGSVHIVATGLSPVGSFLHAFGSGTTYNSFVRELGSLNVAPGPSIAIASDTNYYLGAFGLGATFPVLYEIGGEMPPMHELTPITTEAAPVRAGPDIAIQPAGASLIRYFAVFDSNGVLAIYYHVVNSGGAYWAQPVKLSAPIGTFTFSPTICTENGGFGVSSVNVVAAAGGQLWYSRSSSITSSFSSWMPIAADPASSPDCAVIGAQSLVHVVTTSATGTVVDVTGMESSWVVTNLGSPP